MTDPELADRTYIEPLTPEVLAKIIERERPDALLPTVGGQTALNLAVALGENGTLEQYGVELIGASVEAIKVAEDRLLFRDAMREIGADVPESRYVNEPRSRPLRRSRSSASRSSSVPRSRSAASAAASPTTSKSSASSPGAASSLSPVHEVLLEESVIGWKEFELEVMRDRADNFVVDLLDREHRSDGRPHRRQHHRRAGADAHRSRVPAHARSRRAASSGASASRPAARTSSSRSTPTDGRIIVIEMNPRVSRSSALASKATGFPIAKIAAKLALGYTLDEIPNDITRAHARVVRADDRLRRRRRCRAGRSRSSRAPIAR